MTHTKTVPRQTLRVVRIVLALLVFVGLTFFMVDAVGLLPAGVSLLAGIQLVPALMAVSLGTLAVLLVLTLLVGRVYCSVVCPLGIWQDVVAWLSRRLRPKKHYRYRPARNWLRYSILGITAVAWLAGFSQLLVLLDPYSAYGRICTSLFKPLYVWGNNLLAAVFSKAGNYTFYHLDVPYGGILTLTVSLLTLAVVSTLAWTRGRIWCNTLCPVGALLSLLARRPLFHLHIDASACNHCGRCAAHCKASCIDAKTQTIDASRCVDCFDCVTECRQGAIRLGRAPRKASPAQPDASRRRFLLALGLTGASAVRSAAARKKSIIPGGSKVEIHRQQAVMPPGAGSRKDFLDRCTACHLCVSQCPSHVLKPSVGEYGLEGFLQPVMKYENAFCNYDCHRCGDVCPTHALRPLSVDEKHRTQMGRVVFIRENCVVQRNETSCGACSEHCPTQAISMVPYKYGLTIPQVNPDICVGCGGCEYICPARPFKAVYVEGNDPQGEAVAFGRGEAIMEDISDFGF